MMRKKTSRMNSKFLAWQLGRGRRKHETSGDDAGLVKEIVSSDLDMLFLSNFRDMQAQKVVV